MKTLYPIPFFLLAIIWMCFIKNPVFAQNPFQLKSTSWEGTHSPLKKGNQIFFQGDTLIMVDLEGIKPADQYRFIQKSDTLLLYFFDELSIACREPRPARYRLFWANNGEKLLLKPIEDQCLERFTLLVSESPWYRIREDGSLRNDWYFLDPQKDGVPGISLYEAYKWLRNKKPVPVKVAVLDSPVDYSHEDLKEMMWTNPKEIPDNQTDDDQNGFKDDIRGWCFNCTKAGVHIVNEQPEETQMVAMWHGRFDGVTSDQNLKPEEKKDWQLFQKAKAKWEKGLEKAQLYQEALQDSARFVQTLQKMRKLAKEPVEKNQIMGWDLGAELGIEGIKILVEKTFEDDGVGSFNDYCLQAKKLYGILKKHFSSEWLYKYNLTWNPRAAIGDHPEIPYEKMYGSGQLKNPASTAHTHGTMVAGLIAAKRGNGKGIEGLADNAQIISMGVVPSEGDERDKDVANAIRYAVDQGAKIINMSFGKHFSPHKSTLDEAFRYAEKKNVLMVKAAGNGATNTDTINFYPVPVYENGEKAKNWMVVGNSASALNSHLAAATSNYGSKTVDVFAPGTGILSCTPGNDYDIANGTSLSAPIVSGLAALIWSYFPQLTVAEIKKVILESAYRPKQEVYPPGSSKTAPFHTLSQSGGIVNAKAAILLAEKMSKPKKG